MKETIAIKESCVFGFRRVSAFPAEASPWKKAIGAAILQSGHQKMSIFSACKAQGTNTKLGLRSFERDKYI